MFKNGSAYLFGLKIKTKTKKTKNSNLEGVSIVWWQDGGWRASCKRQLHQNDNSDHPEFKSKWMKFY